MLETTIPTTMKQGFLTHQMSLEEARNVLWLQTNPRPMGELVDEGYLDEKRLRWAESHAYDRHIQAAARVFLNHMPAERVIEKKAPELQVHTLPMTVEQARATTWPFNTHEGKPMGMLVDTGQLSLKDLGFATETAWDKRVRDAARVLMLVRLEQSFEEPESRAGILKVVAGGRSYSERRQLELILYLGLFVGFVTALVVIWTLQKFATNPPWPFNPAAGEKLAGTSPIVAIVALIILVIIFGIGWLVVERIEGWMFERWLKAFTNHRKGQLGEEQVVGIIGRVLDGEWMLFRNVVLPGRGKSDLDAVLVGPPGVWVLEIKNFTGEHKNTGDVWEYRKNNRWSPVHQSPSHQARNNAVKLADFLRADGLSQWIEPVVVWANPDSPLTINNPTVPIWRTERLPDELGNIWQRQDKIIPETRRQQIVDKLTRLCTQPDDADKKEG